jgi:cell division protein ZapA (FtsZ GTPase activity inhibitor)
MTSIRVTVLNEEYALRVDEQHVDFMQRVASQVDARLRGLREQIVGKPDLTYAVIGALALAEELSAARADNARLRQAAERTELDLARLEESVTRLERERSSLLADAGAMADELAQALSADPERGAQGATTPPAENPDETEAVSSDTGAGAPAQRE